MAVPVPVPSAGGGATNGAKVKAAVAFELHGKRFLVPVCSQLQWVVDPFANVDDSDVCVVIASLLCLLQGKVVATHWPFED